MSPVNRTFSRLLFLPICLLLFKYFRLFFPPVRLPSFAVSRHLFLSIHLPRFERFRSSTTHFLRFEFRQFRSLTAHSLDEALPRPSHGLQNSLFLRRHRDLLLFARLVVVVQQVQQTVNLESNQTGLLSS